MNKNKMKLWLIIPVCAIVLLFGGTYAWYVWQTSQDEETIIATDTGYAKVFFDGGSDISGKLKPVSDKSKGMSKEIKVSANKKFIEPITFNLYLDINSIDAGLKNESFKFELHKDGTKIKEGNFSEGYLTSALSNCDKNEGVNHIILTSDTVTTTESVYTLYTWIDGNMSNPLEMEEKDFDFTLHADGQHAILGEKGVEDLPLYANANFTNGLLAENARFESDGYTAVIPQGFKVIDGIDGTQSIAKGLVIQDQKGNEFVWIPVETKKDENSNDIDDGLEAYRARYNSTYTEPYTDGYTNEDGTTEKDDYDDMMLSVQKNKGFYFGRYEAGIAIDPEKDNSRKANQENPDQTVVVQKGAYPYNNVGWGIDLDDYTTPIKYAFDKFEYNEETGLNQGHGAVYLSKNLLKGQTTGATSTLCYGVQ